jgi:hypothetical protein
MGFYIPEDDILHSHRCGHLKSHKSYITCTNRLCALNALIFWHRAPCSPYLNRSFGEMYRLHLQRWNWAEQETRVQKGTTRVSDSADRWYFPPYRLFTYRLYPGDSNMDNYHLSCGKTCLCCTEWVFTNRVVYPPSSQWVNIFCLCQPKIRSAIFCRLPAGSSLECYAVPAGLDVLGLGTGTKGRGEWTIFHFFR